jgi:hypothetical protein
MLSAQRNSPEVAPAIPVPLIALVKPIRLSKHALSYAKKRGFSVAEEQAGEIVVITVYTYYF